MTSQVSTEPQSGTSDFDDEIEPNTGQQSGKGIQGKPIDLRDPQHEYVEKTQPSSTSFDTMLEMQMKQMKCFQELAEQLKYSKNLSLNVASVHTDKRGTKRSHEDSDHDNELDMPQCKQSLNVDDTQLDHAELDNILTHVEDQCEVEETTDTQETVDLKEVNQLMDELLEFYNDSEETSAAVEDSLAKSVNSSLRTQIPDSKFKEMKEKYKRPENCQNLMIPPVNEEVWAEKHPKINAIRSRDLKLQKILGYMIKGMTPIIETTNEILKAAMKKATFEPTKNLRKTTDGIRMLAASYTQLNQYRKDNFKPVLTGKFKKLAYSSNLVTDKLFGDDLQKKIEDIQKSRKISISGFDEKPSGSGYNNYPSNQNNHRSDSSRGRGHFLGQGRFPLNKRGRGGKSFNKSGHR